MEGHVSQEELKAVFDSFDLDKSGTIDLNQIAAISAKLGQKLSDSELKDALTSIDINGDRTISFREFKVWWVLGRKGPMAQLVAYQNEFLKTLKSTKKSFKELEISFGFAQAPKETDKHEIHLSYGQKITVPDLKLQGRFLIAGNKLETLLSKFELTYPNFNRKRPGVAISLKTSDPQGLKTMVQELHKQFKDQDINGGLTFSMVADLKVASGDGAVHLLAQFSQGPGAMFEDMLQHQGLGKLRKFLSKVGPNFFVDIGVQLDINWTLLEALQKNQANLQDIQGVQLILKAETNTLVFKTLRKYILKKKKDLQFLIGIALLKSSSLNFHFKDVNQIKDLLKDFGLTGDDTKVVQFASKTKQATLQNSSIIAQGGKMLPNILDSVQIALFSDVAGLTFDLTLTHLNQIHKKVSGSK